MKLKTNNILEERTEEKNHHKQNKRNVFTKKKKIIYIQNTAIKKKKQIYERICMSRTAADRTLCMLYAIRAKGKRHTTIYYICMGR